MAEFNLSLEASEIQARLYAVPNKVNTADIVDDLTSGGATVPLSAEQGVVLKGLSDTNSTSISELTTEIIEKTGYGVVGTNDLKASAQSTPNMTVSVATGTIYMANGDRFTPATNTALAVTAADATYSRIDIVYVNSSGVIAYLAGTAAASPTAPSVPTGGQKLAEITVAAGATAITSAMLVNRQKTLWNGEWIYPTLINGAAADANNPIRYRKNILGKVEFDGKITTSTGNSAFSMLSGYRRLSGREAKIPITSTTSSTGTFILLADQVYITVGTYYLSGVEYIPEA